MFARIPLNSEDCEGRTSSLGCHHRVDRVNFQKEKRVDKRKIKCHVCTIHPITTNKKVMPAVIDY